MDRSGARVLDAGESLLLPIDRARAAFNRTLLAALPSLTRKDARVTLRALIGIGLALALALAAPMLLFATAPIALGIPHVAADLRYLVLRPSYSRPARAALVGGCVPFVALRIWPATRLLGLDAARLEILFAGAALVAVAFAAALGARAFRRLAIVLPVLIGLGLLAFRDADRALLVFAHGHNLVGVAAWLWIFRARGGARSAIWMPLAAIAIGLGAVYAYGAFVPAGELERPGPGGSSLLDVGSWLAPGLPLRLGASLVVSYIFLQSVHYSVWLGLIPEDAVRGEAVRSFRMSLRALLRDFGTFGLGAVVVVSIVVVGLALRDVTQARETYLSLSAFHGYLELAALVLVASGRSALFARAR